MPLKGAPVPRRVPCRVLSCFSLLCRTVYCLVVLWRFVLCCYAMLRCLVLWRGVLCAVFCCVVLCYVRILTTYTHTHTLLASSEGPGGQVPLKGAPVPRCAFSDFRIVFSRRLFSCFVPSCVLLSSLCCLVLWCGVVCCVVLCCGVVCCVLCFVVLCSIMFRF